MSARRAHGLSRSRPGLSGSVGQGAQRSTFGKITVMATDGHLPYPYGREIAGYEVANLSDTLSKAKAAGVTICRPVHRGPPPIVDRCVPRRLHRRDPFLGRRLGQRMTPIASHAGDHQLRFRLRALAHCSLGVSKIGHFRGGFRRAGFALLQSNRLRVFVCALSRINGNCRGIAERCDGERP